MPKTGIRRMKLIKKRDMILAAAILMAAAVLFGLNWFSRREPAATAQVTVDGKVVYTLDLSRDTAVSYTHLAASGKDQKPD